MLLTIKERLVLLNLLPSEGDFTTLRIVRELREALSFSEAEHVEYGLTVSPEQVVAWRQECDSDEKEVELGMVANSIIIERLKELDGRKKLTDAHLDVYDRFVNGKMTPAVRRMLDAVGSQAQ